MSMKVTKEQFIGMTYDELLAENEKLWVLNEHMGLKDMAVMGELQEENELLQEENAKLRELCVTVIDDWMSKVCPTFPFCECGGEYQDCTDETCGNQIYRQMARELVGWAHEHD